MNWMDFFVTILFAFPGTIVSVLTLVEYYHKWRSEHATKE
jgi:TRAP-type mannitol/chloroaromatic compound transport system permease small subunit